MLSLPCGEQARSSDSPTSAYCDQMRRALCSVSLEQSGRPLKVILRVLLSSLRCNSRKHSLYTLFSHIALNTVRSCDTIAATLASNNAMHTHTYLHMYGRLSVHHTAHTGSRSHEPQHPNSPLAASSDKDMLS